MSYVISKTDYGSLVVGIDTEVKLRNGKKVRGINFDNAATTPPFISVIEEMNNFAPYYSSIHRGYGYKATLSSEKYEQARETVMDFVGANHKKDVVIFVKNATEAINKVAYRLCQDTDEKNIILASAMEHHSNDLPWRDRFEVEYIDIDACGRLIFNDFVEKMEKYKGRVKLVTITGASNVTGYVNPIHRIAEWAHKYGAKILVDASQLIPHMPFEMKPLGSSKHIDFVVFSAHKMYAPFGVGVLIGPKSFFAQGSPDYKGGGTVRSVTYDHVVWNDPPSKDEAGTPNLMGVIALAAAIRSLNAIGMRHVYKHEKALAEQLIHGLKKIDCIESYCTADSSQEHVGIIPFNVRGIYHETLAKILAYEAGISVRSGCFCAHPYVQKLMNIPASKINAMIENPEEPKPGMVRVSFGLYNQPQEVAKLIEVLQEVTKDRRRYIKLYS
ncbi:aminotransferase class V-fold PLP-dependent enzyme [Dehalobacter sp. DCM]|uniref:aminotransferase class V-fold PLP-dependent enzyme n=1 Tax=Dehalobacter sp. DCM TaxID=2907827 RepID=UPI003081CF63|nr:aminotransferase class V-fold PLP-dependent enzyme [Dehalobacter sp. DCM]